MKRGNRSILTALFALLLALALVACGSSSEDNTLGTDSSGKVDDDSADRIAVVGDHSGSDIADHLARMGLDVDNFPYGESINPELSGDYVVWEDYRNGNADIYAYRISTGEEFRVTTDENDQQNPVIDGDYIAWEDYRNGNTDIYAYQISTGEEFAVSTDEYDQSGPKIDGDYVVYKTFEGLNAYRFSTGDTITVATDSGAWQVYYYNIDNDYIVYTRYIPPTSYKDSIPSYVSAYQISTDTEFRVSDENDRAFEPNISGDYIVWKDSSVTYSAINAYRISTDEEFVATNYSSYKSNLQIAGDYIVWMDKRNDNYDIYAYRISKSKEFAVTTDNSDQNSPRIDGNYIVWIDERNGNDDIYAYQISKGEEFAVTTAPFDQGHARIEGDYIVWENEHNGNEALSDIYLSSTDLSISEQWISSGKSLLETVDFSDYSVILFGDELWKGYALSVFDAADAASVNILGIGTSPKMYPVGSMLADDGRFGLSYKYADAYTAAIKATDGNLDHPIFEGFDTGRTIWLGDTWIDGEQVYFTDTGAADSPEDWNVLATMGPSMTYYGDPAIVEFSTPGGTKVILDGSACPINEYDPLTEDHWTLLYNEVVYLMQ